MDTIIAFITEYAGKYQAVFWIYFGLAALGSLITVAKAAIKKTITLKDDQWLADVEAKGWAKWIIDLLEKLGWVKKKEATASQPK